MTAITDHALDLQTDLAAWLETGFGQKFAAGIYGAMAGTDTDKAYYGRLGLLAHQVMIQTGETFAVTEEIVDVLEFAAATVPPYALHESDIPSKAGFVMFERPILIDDIKGKVIVTRAIGWAGAVHQEDVDLGLTSESPVSLMMLMWTDPSDERDHLHDQWVGADGVRAQILEDVGHLPPQGLLSCAGGVWTIGDEPDGDLAKILMAFFRFVQEPWVDPSAVLPSRQAHRRALRRKIEPTVHIVRLRRKTDTQHDDYGQDMVTGEVNWSHRWLVRGHWRNQYYPSIQDHRPRWVQAHVKGPEHLPLIVHKEVFSVDR